MELVCIDFAVEQWRRQSRGRGVQGAASTGRLRQGKVFLLFFAFSLPPRALPVDKLFSFCAASRFLMPPTSQTVAAHSLSLSLSPSLSLPLWGSCSRYPFVALVLQVFQLIFAVLQGQLVGSCVAFFFFSIFGQCCTYYLCSLLLLLLLLLLLRRFFVRSDP